MAIFASRILIIFMLGGLLVPAKGNAFLGRMQRFAHVGVSEEDLKFESNLLSQIEKFLGSEHRAFSEKRLETIKDSLQPIFKALPKNANGKLGHAAVSYALYRLFVQRHAWFITGLEPFKALSEWNSTSAVSVLDERVPAYVSGLFHTRLGEHGFGLHELAVLAVTFEHLVHKESLQRLSAAFSSLNMSQDESLSKADGDEVMDTYMTMYVLGPLIKNLSAVTPEWVKYLRANVTDFYPGFTETQIFVHQVTESLSPSRDYLFYSDIAGYVEEVGGRYGRWQDKECRDLKDMLVEMEDPSAGGAGRVRLADFYKASLYRGKFQLVEGREYLRTLGALDESNPDDLKVIIPNYVNGPSNCVASSSYYSVCCINECEEILRQLEQKIAAPEARPTKIARLISLLPSATVSANRTLSQWLLRRLDEVAVHHGGIVPLHGRLFSQWLHYAYPRECVYPHVAGATSPQTTDKYMQEKNHEYAASREEMERIINMPVPHRKRAEETGDLEELKELHSVMWTMDEELVVWRPPTPFLPSWLRCMAFVMVVLSASLALYRSKSTSPFERAEKCYV